MRKLIDAYRAQPSLAAARRLRDYARKHPFGACLLTPEENYLFQVALRSLYDSEKRV